MQIPQNLAMTKTGHLFYDSTESRSNENGAFLWIATNRKAILIMTTSLLPSLLWSEAIHPLTVFARRSRSNPFYINIPQNAESQIDSIESAKIPAIPQNPATLKCFLDCHDLISSSLAMTKTGHLFYDSVESSDFKIYQKWIYEYGRVATQCTP